MRCITRVLALCFVLASGLASGQTEAQRQVECWRTIATSGALQDCYDAHVAHYVRELSENPAALEAFGEILAEALRQQTPEVVREAAWTLSRMEQVPTSARQALFAALESKDQGIRTPVAVALSKLRPPVVEPLLNLASDSDAFVRRLAASALGECADPRAASRLAQLLADPDGQVRIEALHGLVKIGPGAADALVTLLEDRTTPRPVRNEAVDALQQAKALDPETVGRLIALLEDDELSFYAAAALKGSEDERVPEAMKAYQGRRAQRLWVIIKRGNRGDFFNEFQELSRIAKTPGSGALEILVEAVGLPNPDAAAQAVRVLRHMGIRPLPPAARDALMAAAASPAPVLRDAVALALSSLEPPPVELLLKLSSDPELRVRRSAAEALGLCADNRGATRLTELLADPEEDVRTTARESLKKLGPAAADALLAALNHANGSALEVVLLLLHSVKDPRAADALLRIIEDGRAAWGVRLMASMGLGKIKPADSRIVERLIELLGPLDSPEAAHRAFFAASVLEDLSGGPSDDRVKAALDAYHKSLRVYEAELRAREEGDLVITGGADTCESCGRDSDCPRGMVCRRFSAVGSGEIRRLCALPAQFEIRCRW